MQWSILALSLALAAQDASAGPANGLMARQFAQAAMMRFQCSQLVIDRIDPLVQPGLLPSTHMHQVRSRSLPMPRTNRLPLDRGRKLLQRNHDLRRLRPSLRLYLHHLRLRRRLLKLLDREPLLSRPQRHLQARPPDGEPRATRPRGRDRVLHPAVRRQDQGHCVSQGVPHVGWGCGAEDQAGPAEAAVPPVL